MIGFRTRKRSAPPITNEQIAAAGTVVLALAVVALTVKLVRNRSQRAAEKSPGLRTDTDVADEVRRVARNEIDAVIAALTADGETVPPEAVHEARKGIKRLRALLRLTRHQLGRKVFDAENEALRRVARRLSDSRDSDVMVQTLDEIALRYADEVPSGAFDDLRQALQTKAATERARLAVQAAGIRGAVAELYALRARVAEWPLPADRTVTDLRRGVRDIYRRGRDASDAAYQRPSTKRMHRLRRRTKDLVHTAQLLNEASPKAARISRRGRAVNDILGEEHDLAMLRSGAKTQSDTLLSGHLQLLQTLIDRRRGALQQEAIDQAAMLYNRPPKKILSRFIAGD